MRLQSQRSCAYVMQQNCPPYFQVGSFQMKTNTQFRLACPLNLLSWDIISILGIIKNTLGMTYSYTVAISILFSFMRNMFM
jgi:hypothetical protein